ncbi:unnamed protein product [Calicophoron daubneyi]|uniref:Zinc finger Ran-binding domain-containing protein 2 n=1 Tax=Calicophoron daubneyi TaxID=300641 RepID=A0AAV2U090_CALDB
MSKDGSYSKGDWVCSDPRCGNVNFSKRDKCYRCGKSKKGGKSAKKPVELGKEGADKSKGLFSPDDWVCKNCGNINWARRTICNVCNTSKVNTLGQRTGYGGGFMERDEVVEYKKRNDSDDEFDEFGRKKKRFRKDRGSSDEEHSEKIALSEGANMAQSVTKKNQDEDVDDEESGDDADLAKYDIWGAEHEEDEEEDSKQKRKAEGGSPTKNNTAPKSAESGSSSDSDSSSSSASSSSSSQSGSSSGSSSSSSSDSKARGNSTARSKSSQKSIDRRSDHERSRSPLVART